MPIPALPPADMTNMQGQRFNIDTAEDALWWAFSTMTTVGYGDLVPVTSIGKGVAVLTMFAGIGVFGAFTALIASLLIRPREEHAEVIRLASEITQLREQLKELRTSNTSISSTNRKKVPDL